MAYKINSEQCDACGTCFDTCPSEAIVKGEPHYSIDKEKCIDCAACESACPKQAIAPEA
ncbi:MAG: 4Fe-4S binding protein [Elusimicrobia bacterium]|nr:4Fe-4S binding protein [Elusimicrobiota bacterium]